VSVYIISFPSEGHGRVVSLWA